MLSDFVTYNKSSRKYEVAGRDGETVEFNAGPDGKRYSLRLAVYLASPPLYDLAAAAQKAAPYLESRIWRATELVADHGVTLHDGQGGHVATVRSSNAYGAYNVHRVGGQWVCECEDFTSGFCPADATGPRCKHSLAAEFAGQAALLPCAHCGEANGREVEGCASYGGLVTPF